uniref:Uncharacterized protein n=1 Tax=viral metagenome TaxID=1070528 RepID=A0A2V0R9U7_9ZZZZ
MNDGKMEADDNGAGESAFMKADDLSGMGAGALSLTPKVWDKYHKWHGNDHAWTTSAIRKQYVIDRSSGDGDEVMPQVSVSVHSISFTTFAHFMRIAVLGREQTVQGVRREFFMELKNAGKDHAARLQLTEAAYSSAVAILRVFINGGADYSGDSLVRVDEALFEIARAGESGRPADLAQYVEGKEVTASMLAQRRRAIDMAPIWQTSLNQGAGVKARFTLGESDVEHVGAFYTGWTPSGRKQDLNPATSQGGTFVIPNGRIADDLHAVFSDYMSNPIAADPSGVTAGSSAESGLLGFGTLRIGNRVVRLDARNCVLLRPDGDYVLLWLLAPTIEPGMFKNGDWFKLVSELTHAVSSYLAHYYRNITDKGSDRVVLPVTGGVHGAAKLPVNPMAYLRMIMYIWLVTNGPRLRRDLGVDWMKSTAEQWTKAEVLINHKKEFFLFITAMTIYSHITLYRKVPDWSDISERYWQLRNQSSTDEFMRRLQRVADETNMPAIVLTGYLKALV